MEKQINYIFFSSSNFGKIILRQLLKKFPPLFLITKKPKPQQREKILKLNPAAELALKKHLPFFEFEDLNPDYVKTFQPLFGLVSGFGRILKKDWLDIFPLGILNIHPSLLPKFRGPSPIQATILSNEKPGITIFLIDEGVDTGQILWQKEVNIQIDYYEKMEQQLALAGAKLFLDNIKFYLEGQITPKPQEGQIIITSKITLDKAQISKEDSLDLAWRKVLAFHQEPVAWLKIKINNEEKILKIYRARKIKETTLKSWLKKEISTKLKWWPQILMIKNNVFLVLKDGYLMLEEIQLEGKKKMSGQEFFNGYFNKKIEIV